MIEYPLLYSAARKLWNRIADNLQDRSIYDKGHYDDELVAEIAEEQINLIYDVLKEVVDK